MFWCAYSTVQVCINRDGMITITPDTRHSLNSSGGDIAKFTFGGHAADLADVLAWMKAQKWFTGPLHLAGYTLGGFSALKVAAHLRLCQ